MKNVNMTYPDAAAWVAPAAGALPLVLLVCAVALAAGHSQRPDSCLFKQLPVPLPLL